jgi:diguanylate cyclase (GGDEF) domain
MNRHFEKLSANVRRLGKMMAQMVEELNDIGNIDPTTGAYGRAYFEAELERIDVRGRGGEGLLFVDVNGLTFINEAFGSKRGDAAICTVAGILHSACDGIVCRTGGSEFAVLAYGTSIVLLQRTADIVRETCESEMFRSEIPYGISCGIAYRPDAATSADTFLRLAQNALRYNKLSDPRSTRGMIVHSLKEAMRERNLETMEHLCRMECMAGVLAEKLNIEDEDRDRLVLLAALHDIGKIAVPDDVIAKPGELDDREWRVMCGHCEAGYRIAAASRDLSCISLEILHHHERWDGQGYPRGLAGEDIPLLSRVISVVDSYDVMTHARAYKTPIGHRDALREVRACSGAQFDPGVAALFLDAFGDDDSFANACPSGSPKRPCGAKAAHALCM